MAIASPSPASSISNDPTISLPRARFITTVIFITSSTIYALSRIISGINMQSLYRTAMFSSIFVELLAFNMTIPVKSQSQLQSQLQFNLIFKDGIA